MPTYDLFATPVPPSATTWLDDPMAAALAWLRTERTPTGPYSAATIQKHLSIVRRYLASLRAGNVDLLQAQPADIARFLNAIEHLQRDGTLALTRHRYLRTLEALYDQLQRERLRADNPARALIARYPPPRSRPLPEALTPAEEARLTTALLEALHGTPRPWRELRDAAIVATAIGSGLQPRELIALQVHDVHLDETPPFLTVAAYGRRPERVAPIGPAIRPVLAAWRAARDQLPAAHSTALFCASRHGC